MEEGPVWGVVCGGMFCFYFCGRGAVEGEEEGRRTID